MKFKMLGRTEALPLIKFNYPCRKKMHEFAYIRNVMEGGKDLNLSQFEPDLLNRTFHDDGNHLYLYCSMWHPRATNDRSLLEM